MSTFSGEPGSHKYNVTSFVGELDEILLGAEFSEFIDEMLDTLTSALRKRGNSNATINRKMAALSKLLKKAQKMGEIPGGLERGEAGGWPRLGTGCRSAYPATHLCIAARAGRHRYQARADMARAPDAADDDALCASRIRRSRCLCPRSGARRPHQGAVGKPHSVVVGRREAFLRPNHRILAAGPGMIVPA
jgi:hypothetical protein